MNGPPPPAQPGRPENVASKFDDELHKLKGMAVGAAFGLLRTWIGRSVPVPLADQVRELIDSVTRKLGGEPVRGDLLENVTGLNGRRKTSRERNAGNEARVGDLIAAG